MRSVNCPSSETPPTPPPVPPAAPPKARRFSSYRQTLEWCSAIVQGAAAALWLLRDGEEGDCVGERRRCKQLLDGLACQLEDAAEELRSITERMSQEAG